MGPLSFKGEKILEDLRVMNALRGVDGCGAAFINHQQHIHNVKGLELPHDLTYLPRYIKAKKRNNICIIAHSRSATVGKISDEMCHPFTFKNVTGCHNGTVFEHGLHYLYQSDQYNSDSEAIMASIDKWGIEKAWGHVNGAASLVFWDKRKKGLCMIRNAQRPMFFAFLDVEGKVDTGTVMIYASEAWMLTGITTRHNVKISQIWSPSVDTLLVFQWNKKNKKISYTMEKLKAWSWKDHNDVYYAPHKTPYKTPLPQNNTPEKAIFSKTISEQQWQDQYLFCESCNKGLLGEYKAGVILDEHSAICGYCALELSEHSQKSVPWRQ